MNLFGSVLNFKVKLNKKKTKDENSVRKVMNIIVNDVRHNRATRANCEEFIAQRKNKLKVRFVCDYIYLYFNSFCNL